MIRLSLSPLPDVALHCAFLDTECIQLDFAVNPTPWWFLFFHSYIIAESVSRQIGKNVVSCRIMHKVHQIPDWPLLRHGGLDCIA